MAQPSEPSQSRLLQSEVQSQDHSSKPRQLDEQHLDARQTPNPLPYHNHASNPPDEASTGVVGSSRPLHNGGAVSRPGETEGGSAGESNLRAHTTTPNITTTDSSTGRRRPLTNGTPHPPAHQQNVDQNGARPDGGGLLSNSSSMSSHQPPPGPHRPPVGYPNPNPYVTAMHQGPPQYHAYAPQPTHGDMYRASAAAAVNPSMALPSMRTLDPMQSQHQQQPPPHAISMAPPMGGPMAPGVPPMPYYSVGAPYTMGDSMRFALPGMSGDPRIAMSGGRHKKEIKRRTKTGCLTCRKRRIKCDEAHPTCNNCKKSKRDCLGYDPIFKPALGPPPIQPAPNSLSPTAPNSLGSTPPATVPSSVPPISYRPPVVPSSYPPPPTHPGAAFDSLSPVSQGSKPEGTFEYAPVIDPALQASHQSSFAGSSAAQYRLSKSDGSIEHQHLGVSSQQRAPKMKVDELVALEGSRPPALASAPSGEAIDEMIRLYYELYAPGLISFFESQWFDFKRPQSLATDSLIRNNPTLLGLFSSFLQTVSSVESADPSEMTQASSIEIYVVWALACLPNSALTLPRRPSDPSPPPDDDPLEVRNRLLVFEALLSGGTLLANPLSLPPSLPTYRSAEIEFWYHLGQYLLQSYSADAAAREHCLGRLRSSLQGRENRDALYSIAILRELSAHLDPVLSEQSAPSFLEETDPRSRLAVATRFVREQAASTGGTTNVIRRFATLAYRAYVRPGLNSNRHA